MSWPIRCTCLAVLIAFPVALSFAGHKSGDDPSASRSDKIKFKPALDSKSLGTLRDQLQVDDTEWAALLPRIQKVQMLIKEIYVLHDPIRSMDPAKLIKVPKDPSGNPFASNFNPSNAPLYLVDLGQKGQELKQVSGDVSARASDIEYRLAEFRKARAVAEKELGKDLTKARAELTELLTARQELVCVMSGLLE